jgi:hypothetical protein
VGKKATSTPADFSLEKGKFLYRNVRQLTHLAAQASDF